MRRTIAGVLTPRTVILEMYLGEVTVAGAIEKGQDADECWVSDDVNCLMRR